MIQAVFIPIYQNCPIVFKHLAPIKDGPGDILHWFHHSIVGVVGVNWCHFKVFANVRTLGLRVLSSSKTTW